MKPGQGNKLQKILPCIIHETPHSFYNFSSVKNSAFILTMLNYLSRITSSKRENYSVVLYYFYGYILLSNNIDDS